MLVSVITPVYNVERYLRQCLDSLRTQTLQDVEFICVDDGSTDGSLSILREYERQDPRFKVIAKENGGYGSAINAGIAAARGTYLGVLESDDFADPSMFEQLALRAEALGVDLVRTDILLYWSTPHERMELAHYTLPDGYGEPFVPRERPECFFLPPTLYAMLVKRSVVEGNDLRLLETPGASYQDTAFSFKLWACARCAAVFDDAYVHYRQDNEASSINQPDKIECVPYEYAEIERFLRADMERFGDLLPLMVRRKFGAYMWNYKRLAPRFHGEFAETMAAEFSTAAQEGIVDADLFSSDEWSDLQLLMEDAPRFVERMDVWNEARVRAFRRRSRMKRAFKRLRG